MDELTPEHVLVISERMQTRGETWMRPRKAKNDENWLAYRGQQDWSHKAPYQSKETTPGFPIAVDQVVGTFERAATDSSDWLLAQPVGYAKPFLEPDLIQKVLEFYLGRIYKPGNHAETGYGVQMLVSDSVKRGILEPYIIAKVFPVLVKKRHYRFKVNHPSEPGALPGHDALGDEVGHEDIETMRLCIELLGWDDYLRDPSPACRWEIHRSRRQISELLANEDYDPEAVRRLLGKANDEYDRRSQNKSIGERAVSPDPYDIEVLEAWGDVIDERSGEVLAENVFWTWAGKELLRAPTPNPSWDGTRPFIVASIVRVPGSVEPKALADHVVPMWRAANELYNLLLDQAMRAAWGVGQVRPDIMESPEEVEDGIPQGYTAVLRPNVPQGYQFYERVDNGQRPEVSIDGLIRTEQYINEGLAMPDTRLGQIPARATKATETVQAMQASGSLYESFAARYEDSFLEPLFEKCWKTIIQYADDFMQPELVSILGPINTLRIAELSSVERWQLLHRTTFRVRGLRGVATKDRMFTKGMTIVNLLSSNQQFMDHFGQTYSFEKLWTMLLRGAGVDPTSLEKDEEEEAIEAGSAGGQLDPTLAGSNGASQPNVTDAAGATGASTEFAPNNPNQNPAA